MSQYAYASGASAADVESELTLSRSDEAALYQFIRMDAASAGHLDHFRYEILAKKVSRVASGYGNAHDEATVKEWLAAMQAERATLLPPPYITPAAEPFADVRAGKVGNPLYQAFLDTLEFAELQAITSNVPYFAWHTARSADHQRVPAAERPPFPEFLRAYAERHLSARVRAERQHQDRP